MAAYLLAAGHDVRVVASDREEPDQSLAVEIGPERIVRVRWLDVDRWLDPRNWFRRRQRKSAAGASTTVRAATSGAAWRTSWSSLYQNAVLYPDRSIGWCLRLLPALVRLMRVWPPDVILVSGPPFSTFIAVALASRRAEVPWVAEFRDRWADDRYTRTPDWRRKLDRRLERRLVSRAAGIVTVSEPWARVFASRYAAPVATVMNGFDPHDFPPSNDAPLRGLPVRILHLGTIYPERRDPSALFLALLKGRFTPEEVRVVFYGHGVDWVRMRSRDHGAEPFIETHAQVPRDEALRLQRAADVLLLLQWDDPSEVGNVPAKVFEYLAIRRPVLGLGPLDGVAADLVRQRSAGLFSNDPAQIARQLRSWVERKRGHEQVPALPASVSAGLTRAEQFARLEAFLVATVRKVYVGGPGQIRAPGRPATDR